MAEETAVIARDDWPALAKAFTEFFAGAGQVTVTDDLLRFAAAEAGTGLELRRDGSSESFMPLHGLEARWQAVHFAHDTDEVVLEGDGVSYTYRVPPSLRAIGASSSDGARGRGHSVPAA